MTFEEAALVACVGFAGLWAGLLAMLTLVMHPMLRAMTGRDFALFLRENAGVRAACWPAATGQTAAASLKTNSRFDIWPSVPLDRELPTALALVAGNRRGATFSRIAA